MYLHYKLEEKETKFDFVQVAPLEITAHMYSIVCTNYSREDILLRILLYICNVLLFNSDFPGCFASEGKGAAGIQVNNEQKIQNVSKMPLMDNINNTIYITLAQHTSIHTSTFYLITIVNSGATVKFKLGQTEGRKRGTPYDNDFGSFAHQTDDDLV
jgi:hypothetical protein